ncbi:MAG: GGDEF domain-containing protein [Alphaproteobacteria bacterium]|nr:MAG: GGDEF domain-containing protein [Alphaproteobacteria bacterium]
MHNVYQPRRDVMKTAQSTATRKWPAVHGLATYNFVPPTAEVSRLHQHISSLESRLKQQASLIATLAERANHDSLTGLLNRRGMEIALSAAITNYKRYGHNGALLMLDLNHFKSVNDIYGHAAGDALLRHVANGLRETTRSTDALCRLGGDEFMVFLMEASLPHALLMARRLRTWLEANPCTYEGTKLCPHISVGIAQVSEAPAMPGLVELADMRMYRFKQAIKSVR